MPTFKDIEESIDTLSRDDDKNAMIKKYEDSRSYASKTVQKTIYAKRLLRSSARLFIKAGDRKMWDAIKTTLKAKFTEDRQPSDTQGVAKKEEDKVG